MSDLDKVLDQLVAGDEAAAKETFHSMVVQQSRDEFNKLQPQDAPVSEAVDKTSLKAGYDKYNEYKSADVDKLADGMFKFYRDSGVELDAIEKREYAVLVKKYGEDRITGDAFDYLDDDGITSSMFKEFAQIMGEPASEKSSEKALSMLGLDEGNDVVGFGIAD